MEPNDTPRLVSRFRLQSLVILCAAALTLLVGAVAVGAYALLGTYERLESAAAHEQAARVIRGFGAALDDLEPANRHYARRNDAEAFVRGRDRGFAARTFSPEALRALDADLVWIVGAGGDDLFSALVDPKTRAVRTPAPEDALAPFRPLLGRHEELRALPPAQRTVATPRGLAAFAQTEIARADGTRPTGAYLVFARYVEAAELARVESASGVPFTLTYVAAEAPAAALPQDVADWAHGGADRAATYVRAADASRIVGYAALRGAGGETLAVFATAAPRDVSALGRRVAFYLAGSIAVLFLVFAATVVALVARLLYAQRRNLEHRRAAEELQWANRRNLIKQVQEDVLTQLPNRIFLESRLPKLLAKIADSRKLLALIHIDVDHFKNINESLGHAAGDQMLKIIAKRLRSAAADTDLVVRMGGDEFVVVAPLMPSTDSIEAFVSRLEAAVASDMLLDGRTVNVTASVGIAIHPQDGTEMGALLKHADIALYQAKEAGRRCHRFFSADMTARIRNHTNIEQALRKAIGTKQIYMEYQPIVDLRDGRVVSLEALMRWRHPQRGLISPAQFIPVAEHSGLIVELGEQALRLILKQQRAWLDDDVPIVPIAVNVSALQVERVDFPALVAELAAGAGLEPRWVRFEITESAMTKEPEKLIGTLLALRNMGSQVLIDDFGTGYSSLSYLDRLPADIVKIDRAFMRDIKAGEEPPIVHAIINMARRLRMKTVAEGIETASQAALLLRWGCHYGQGYFYSRPVEARHCRALLEHLRREKALTQSAVVRALSA